MGPASCCRKHCLWPRQPQRRPSIPPPSRQTAHMTSPCRGCVPTTAAIGSPSNCGKSTLPRPPMAIVRSPMTSSYPLPRHPPSRRPPAIWCASRCASPIPARWMRPGCWPTCTSTMVCPPRWRSSPPGRPGPTRPASLCLTAPWPRAKWWKATSTIRPAPSTRSRSITSSTPGPATPAWGPSATRTPPLVTTSPSRCSALTSPSTSTPPRRSKWAASSPGR